MENAVVAATSVSNREEELIMTKTESLIILRRHLMDNIQLADNKAFGLLKINPDNSYVKDLCLEVVSPTVIENGVPKGYKPFSEPQCEEHLAYECKVLKEIVQAKYAKVNEMIKVLKG